MFVFSFANFFSVLEKGRRWLEFDQENRLVGQGNFLRVWEGIQFDFLGSAERFQHVLDFLNVVVPVQAAALLDDDGQKLGILLPHCLHGVHCSASLHCRRHWVFGSDFSPRQACLFIQVKT